MPAPSNHGESPGKLAWKRFRKNPLAMTGGVFLILCVFAGLFAYFLMPDASTNGNFQVLELARKPPGTTFSVLLKPSPGIAPVEKGFFSFLLFGKEKRYDPILLRSPLELSIRNDSLHYVREEGFAESLPLSDFKIGSKPVEEKVFEEEYVLTRTFLLGSDASGRDVLSRLILGTRVSLSVGFLAVLISLVLGIFLGGIAGFFGGRTDAIVMWFVSVIWSIPTLLLAISLTFIWEKGFWQIFIAIGLSMWVEVARIVRGQILSVREMQYVEAAKAMGYSSFRTLFLHVLPNVINPVIIIAAANFASAILVEAGLSFLGVGVQAPVPSWGGMIREGYTYIVFENGKWLALIPGIAIVLVVISLNLVGFGLRDALDPKAATRK